jgi:hypothetical protein
MRRQLLPALALVFALLLPQSLLAWNATGHQVVAGIAWDNMTPAARRNVIGLLQAAPEDACLRDLFPTDARPLELRQREFFMRAATWADLVRSNGDDDKRACTRFHRRDWHFINYFWEGISGATGEDAPRNRRDVKTPEVDAVERLGWLRQNVTCSTAVCATSAEERATMLAWILHLAGDIHQPLHASARVTTAPGEEQGDQGGNLFKLGTEQRSPSLHSYWDRIVDASVPRRENETNNYGAYLDRVIAMIEQEHPRAAAAPRLHAGDFAEWSLESFETTTLLVYPATLQRNVLPDDAYRERAFAASRTALAMAGYRLADLLNQMFA